MRWSVLSSPVGEVSIGAVDGAVVAVRFDGVHAEPAEDPLLDLAAAQLRAYFAGELTEFDVPLRVLRGSDFERAVWREIAAIRYGEMITYGAIAAALGEAGGARAVGAACNRNPMPLIVPCHRVVGAGNKLTGFGGGLPRKRFLLELEARFSLERSWREARQPRTHRSGPGAA